MPRTHHESHYFSAELNNRINGFFRRLYRYGYTPALVDMEQLLRDADETLLKIFYSPYMVAK